MAAQESARPLLLPFYDLLHLSTKSFDYYALAKQGGPPSAAAAALAASVRPDYLAQLTFHRGAISAWLQSAPAGSGAGSAPAGVVPDLVPRELEALAGGLHGLVRVLAPPGGSVAAVTAAADGGGDGGGVAIAAAAAATSGMVRSEWTSGISNKPQRMIRLDSLPQELAMVYSLYAATLRHTAIQSLEAAAAGAAFGALSAGGGGGGGDAPAGPRDGGGSPAASSPGSGTAAGAAGAGAAGAGLGAGGGGGGLGGVLGGAVAGLRRAAGVYAYLADVLLPELRGGGGGGDRPLELLPAAARLAQLLSRAEAQAAMAAAAAVKGLSAGAQRALHAGCVTLFRQAEDAARELAAAAPPGLPPCERLLRLLAASAGAHAGRAALLAALERQRAMELGEAEAACEDASRLLEGALRRLDRSDPPAWAEAVKVQAAQVAPLQAAVHKDRLSVTYQALPRSPPDATANAAVKVAPEPFAPAPITPPAPPPEQVNRGGCVLM